MSSGPLKPRVKICGLTRRADAEAAIAAGADLLGFVLVPGTPRAVTVEGIRWVRDIAGAETVGVFRDATLEQVLAAKETLALDRVQLHGDEPDEWLEALGGSVLRRVPVPGRVDWARVRGLAARCLPLLDPGAGDGVAAELELLAGAPAGLAFGLAGGLTPETVAAAVRACRPVLVDVSSGVESAPGIKDPGKVAAFIREAKGAWVPPPAR